VGLLQMLLAKKDQKEALRRRDEALGGGRGPCLVLIHAHVMGIGNM
jgi:hypothetical protein